MKFIYNLFGRFTISRLTLKFNITVIEKKTKYVLTESNYTVSKFYLDSNLLSFFLFIIK